MIYCFKLLKVPVVILQFDCDMCLGHKWALCAAACLGLIQSIIWIGLSIAGALVYTGTITVKPYREPNDFFRVTLAKLYFEGPNINIDGTYLGKFNDDYRNPNKIDLLWPDKVFALCVAYVIISVFYFFVSILLLSNRNTKTPEYGRRFLDIALRWSCITLLLCAIDVVFVYFLFRDFMNIKDYINKSECENVTSLACKHISELAYVPLALALLVGRIVIFWIWNVIFGCIFFFDALCCKHILGGSPQAENKPAEEQKVRAPAKPHQELPPVKLINKSYSTSYDIRRDRDSVDVKRSMEAVTRFSDDCGKSQGCRVYTRRDWDYVPPEGSVRSAVTWQPTLHFKEWDAINEGYESDENGSVIIERTHYPNENEELKQKQIKVVRPPIGKPVSIPIPPPLPVTGSSNC